MIVDLKRRRLADEYDAAQERGGVATDGRPKTVPSENGLPATAADVGLSRKDIHEARLIRDAEQAEPAVFAKQADDDTLRKLADRIQARAVGRCGELLKTYDVRGSDRSKSRSAPTFASPSRAEVAKAAGMSRASK